MESGEAIYFVRAFVRAWETGTITLWGVDEVRWAERILAAIDNDPPFTLNLMDGDVEVD